MRYVLTPQQREGLRSVHDGKAGEVNRNTLRALRRRMLVELEKVEGGHYVLTPAGQREHDRVMESGDGPEALKELFRF